MSNFILSLHWMELNLMLVCLEQLTVSGADGERVLRSEHRAPQLPLDMTLPTRKRKPLTPQQLEERKKKVD